MNELHQGDKLSATIVTTQPPAVVTEREVQATLAKAAPPAAVPAAPPVRPVEQPVATTARNLPHTAGALPTIGLVGVLALALAAVAARRRLAK